ncbi:procathepsin L-like [Ruditapes philippinarum]|uniref:procathepsin L-like n=1 Tax=Ruditapes philippinarum TaxID=129788 RepID=UPI00295BA95D|nr:procathepsin L-like [Ruditapes philippinarum]
MRCLKCLILFVFPFVVEPLSLKHVNEEWQLFKLKFNRTYTCPRDEAYRYSVFADNLQTIQLHNMAADKGESTYWMGINNFADLTDKEFEERYTGLKIRPEMIKRTQKKFVGKKNFNLTRPPKEMDWRKLGCVTKIKFQGLCGSCYAFAATGALEGQTCRKKGKLVSLSEQNIIDCTSNPMFLNDGCTGGQAENSYQYVIDNGGIDTESSYPYTGKVGKCKFSKENIGATVEDYIDIPFKNELRLQNVVANLGPASVCIDTRGAKHYRYGIYDGVSKIDLSMCSEMKVNHAMTAIGYGRSNTGMDFWILKNSWGEDWGEKGYMRLIRNHGNRCGITTMASYPVV